MLIIIWKKIIIKLTGPDKLSKPVAAQKWDRIKLVCTQPFNKVLVLFLLTFQDYPRVKQVVETEE